MNTKPLGELQSSELFETETRDDQIAEVVERVQTQGLAMFSDHTQDSGLKPEVKQSKKVSLVLRQENSKVDEKVSSMNEKFKNSEERISEECEILKERQEC